MAPHLQQPKTAALNGVILQMFNHGGMGDAFGLWLLLEKRSGGLRGRNDFGGLALKSLRYSAEPQGIRPVFIAGDTRTERLRQ